MARISVTLLSYNHQAFIREALDSCLALEGGPYDIVVSDDASTDLTQEYITQRVKAYDGPHSVTLNFNRRNVGIQENKKLAVRACKGDYILGCGGDDVLLPNRARESARFLTKNPDAAALLCSAYVIDAVGAALGTIDLRDGVLTPVHMIAHGGGAAIGPCYAYRRDCLEEYFATSTALAAEDRVIPLIASLRGAVVTTRLRLLKYRKHASSLTYTGSRPYLHPYENPRHVEFMREILAQHRQLSIAARMIIATKRARHANASAIVRKTAGVVDRCMSRLCGLNVMQIGSYG